MLTEELKTIFESVDKELLSEDTLKTIATLVESAVARKVDERMELEVENAIKTQYEKFKVVSEKAVAAIDEDHTNKIKLVVKALKEDAENKMKTIHEGYKKIISKTAIKHRDSLVESVDEFLDLYIEKNLPKNQITEAAKNKYALKAIEEARKVLGVDDKYITNNIKEALVDGKRQMDKLVSENTELKKRTLINESKNVLDQKTANLPVELARFVRSRLDGKPASFIKENFKYVVDMFERQEKSQKRSALLNENKQQFIVDRTRVADEIIRESEIRTKSNTVNPTNPMESVYMDGLNFRK
jgi:hypothetical protein